MDTVAPGKTALLPSLTSPMMALVVSPCAAASGEKKQVAVKTEKIMQTVRDMIALTNSDKTGMPFCADNHPEMIL
jgi:hypothetical protein